MRVLVVEDDVGLAEAIAEGLDDEGFDVELSHDGIDGLWRARERSYGAIVLDILLPGMNGYKVCQTLREEGIWTPVLMLTAKTGEYDEAEALDTGADDFLSKPFSFVVLVARLRALARRDAGPRPRELIAGDLALDPVHRTCRRGDVPIELTRREYALLEALLRHAGEGSPNSACCARCGETTSRARQRGQVYVRLPATQDRRALRETVAPDGARQRWLPAGRRWLTARRPPGCVAGVTRRCGCASRWRPPW